MSQYLEAVPPIKYGELIVLGYNGSLTSGNEASGGEARMKRLFTLCQRPKANGVKPSPIHNQPSAKENYSISYALSPQAMVEVVEYAPDRHTDMFQIGRFRDRSIDFVVKDTVPGCPPDQSTISRFACRIVCQRSPPYTARIYAAGFDNSRNIFLGNKAVQWKSSKGQMDGLTTNGVLVMHPPQDSKAGVEWSEISVCGNVFKLRDSPQQGVEKVEGVSHELVDGSLIDLCGVTLMWSNPPAAQSGRRGSGGPPPSAHLEHQHQGLHARRPCIVYKYKDAEAPWAGDGRWAFLDQGRLGSELKNLKAAFFRSWQRNAAPDVRQGDMGKKDQDANADAEAPLAGVGRLAFLDQVRSGSELNMGEKKDKKKPIRKISDSWVTQNAVGPQVDILAVMQKKHDANDVFKLTLDPNTAHAKISLSEHDRKVTRVEREQKKISEHADRFLDYGQVMSRQSMGGRCYWEVEWSGGFEIAVTYRGIDKRGDGSQFGSNDKSWSLRCDGGDDSYAVWHNATKTDLAVRTPSSRSGRVAVYVDWPAGTVTFCTVSSRKLTHLHTFRTTFTKPLYAGFWVGWPDSSVHVCKQRFHL